MNTTQETALQRLFTPGPHIGWQFRSRESYVVPFTEPAPIAQPADTVAPPPPRSGVGRTIAVGMLGGVLTVLLGMCGFIVSGPSGPGASSFGTMLVNTAVLLLMGIAGVVALMIWQRPPTKVGSTTYWGHRQPTTMRTRTTA